MCRHTVGLFCTSPRIRRGRGTGARSLQALETFRGVERLTAIEPDRDMIAVAKEKYADARTVYVQSTAEDMAACAIAGAPLGAVMSNWALHWVSDKPRLMRDDWRGVFEPQEIAASIRAIT